MTDTMPEHESGASPRKRRTTWLALGVVVATASVLAFVFVGRFGVDPRLVESPLIGQPLPDLALEYLEQDGVLDFSELRGKILVINIWASWCFPCRLEHPLLTSAADVYESRNVHVVGISYQDQRDSAIAFLDEFGRGENYSYVIDADSRATVELGVFGVPETFFVDAEGIVRGRYQGELEPTVLVDVIEDLLAGRPVDI